ncbi:MAG: hypothetical protein P1T08_08640 [Acidimicrobiia bacterium]|nr:hypothetical protein [Acidimicrobiia bacterium]
MPWLEAILTGAGGAGLAWIAGLPLGLAPATAVIGGLNGLISGSRAIYDWRTAGGWGGYALDSSWGLIGTAGSLVLHLVQRVLPSGNYRKDLSRRRGRHVYEGGYRLKRSFATTVGNVITNADGLNGLDGASGPRRRLLIDRHEMLHVWQHRWFGPLFPALYGGWAVVGAVGGLLVGLLTKRSVAKAIFTIAYYDNPFEYWAYRRDRYWPPSGADPSLAWRGTVEDQRTGTIL